MLGGKRIEQLDKNTDDDERSVKRMSWTREWTQIYYIKLRSMGLNVSAKDSH